MRWRPPWWLRDVWMLLTTGLIALALIVQTHDRKSFELANVEARYGDCLRGNSTRLSLRKQVEAGRLQRPLLLKLLPTLDTTKVIELIDQDEREELRGFMPNDCVEVAEEALAGHHKRYRLDFIK